jgi:hypothetical protein
MQVLVFGANGTLGGEIVKYMRFAGDQVLTVSRNSEITDIQTDSGMNQFFSEGLKFDSCVWAQGKNINDSITDAENFNEVFDANIGYIISSLKFLLNNQLLNENARLVIISSIWQEISKTNKFSYTVSKSALKGLVNSFVADYSTLGYSMNALLPGVVDTPMTRANLTNNQITGIEEETPTRKLVSPEDVARATHWLASPNSAGINGQFIRVDNGWSRVRAI